MLVLRRVRIQVVSIMLDLEVWHLMFILEKYHRGLLTDGPYILEEERLAFLARSQFINHQSLHDSCYYLCKYLTR